MQSPENILPAEPGGVGSETPTIFHPPLGRDGPTVCLESAAPTPAPDAPSTVVVHGNTEGELTYQILQEIGRGGMSVVYLACDVKLGRFVALKRLGAAFRANPSMRERFFREARLIAALNHIHIVRLFDFDEDEKGPFIVMEYVPGPGKALLPDRPPPSLNLERKVEQNQAALWPREAVSLVRKLCGAVDYAHRHGVIHRDLKPSNVLLDEFSEPRIVDFGLARQAQADGEKLTLTGTRLFSLGYGAPEQEQDAGLADARSDVYSLGGILYFCLTGENPRFFRDSRVADFLRPALLKALERDPNLRWTSAAEFAEALSQSTADYLSPLTDVGMWRCKWCNALNPLSSRFCHQCQWDGMEPCPECEGETRVGVRFCGTCGTDIKAFEDAQGLARRVRELRRQKDFAGIKEAAEGAARFQARGPRGLDVLRQIAEIGETADWAVKRKDEISQAITKALERENFEAVRERLNEYDLLAEGDEYEALRKELPWRMAERDLMALRDDVNRARDLLAQKKLGECRRILEAVRVRRLHLSRLEVQFPILQGLFAGAEAPAGGDGANEFARALGAASKDIERLEQSLSAFEEKVAKLLDYAKDALRLQDYVCCAAACRGVREITADPSDADVILTEVVSSQQQIEKSLASAEQAARSGHYLSAERICRQILDRYKRDCAEAKDLLVRIAQGRKRRGIWTAAAAMVLMVSLYVVSIAPIHQAVESGLATTVSRADLRRLYAPVFWLHDHTFLQSPLDAYAKWWGLPIF